MLRGTYYAVGTRRYYHRSGSVLPAHDPVLCETPIELSDPTVAEEVENGVMRRRTQPVQNCTDLFATAVVERLSDMSGYCPVAI